MKFIRTIDGDYVSVKHVVSFTVEQSYAKDVTKVFFTLENGKFGLLKTFADNNEAHKWLDELVAKIEAEAD